MSPVMEQEKVEMRKAVEEDVLGFPEEDRELARLLIRAARDEIHRDYENAHSRRYKEFLLHIENELTDPKLNVTTARSVAGLTGTSTYATEFSRIVGMNPGAYIEHHRMKLARRLLQHTGGRAKITCVALAVGYENSNYFSDRYNKVMDYRPRREPRADSGSSSALLQQLTKAEATRRQQPHKPEKKCDHYVPQGEGVSAFWEEIRSLDRKGVLDYLSHNSRRLDTHHFSFLLEKSKLEGRKSRERGEELALISLDCLRAIELRKGCDFINEKVLGYTALAKARRLRLDFVGANEAFEAIDMIRLERTKPEVYLQVNISKAHL